MKLLLLLLLFVAIGELILAEETTTPPRAKNGTAAGHYRPSYNRHRHRDYDDDDYDRSYHRRRTPIIDDYVCDLEATILVVSSKHQRKGEKSYGGGYEQPPSYGNNNDYSPSGSYGPAAPPPHYDSQYGNGPSYGGGSSSYGDDSSYGSAGGYGAPKYENKPKGGYKHDRSKPDALRLKCSHIAINSERDCHTCCQLSARHYRVSRGEIFGFIIDASEIKYDGKGYVRQKRSDNYAPAAPSPSYPSAPSPSYPSAPSPSYPSVPSPSYPSPSYPAAPAPSYPAPAYPGDSSYPAPAYSADQQYPAAPTPGYGSSDYQAATPSYGGQNEYYGPPKNARCVCCAPKHYRHGHRHHRRHYDDSDSDEY